jgi:hypothetical protein
LACGLNHGVFFIAADNFISGNTNLLPLTHAATVCTDRHDWVVGFVCGITRVHISARRPTILIQCLSSVPPVSLFYHLITVKYIEIKQMKGILRQQRNVTGIQLLSRKHICSSHEREISKRKIRSEELLGNKLGICRGH